MTESWDGAADTRPGGPRHGVQVRGARTPEELEMLLEDAFVTRDRAALVELFEADAALVTSDALPARGETAIAGWATAMWAGNRTYVADPRQITQARDLALIVAARGTSVARRGRDGAWRYTIAFLSLDDGTP